MLLSQYLVEDFGTIGSVQCCVHQVSFLSTFHPPNRAKYKLPFESSAGVGEGLSAAHKSFRLLLLPSGPDKVHGVLLRRTQTMPGEAFQRQFKLPIYYIVFSLQSQYSFGLVGNIVVGLVGDIVQRLVGEGGRASAAIAPPHQI